MKTSRLLPRGHRMVGLKLSRQRLERALQPCPWRKSKRRKILCRWRVSWLSCCVLIIFFTKIFLYLYRYAGAVFADACLKGLNGVPDIVECTFVQSTVTGLPFFASKVHTWLYVLLLVYFFCCMHQYFFLTWQSFSFVMKHPFWIKDKCLEIKII
jgi:hypothetical protein